MPECKRYLRKEPELPKRGWGRINEELKASSGHDFERKVLPLLRIRWAMLVHPKSLKALDRDGIDQVLVADGDPLSVVVQCKGFEVIEPLDDSQLKQINKSIDKFIASKHRCKTYLLVYNRFATDRSFHTKVEASLTRIVAAGKATKALVWDLNELSKQLASDLSKRLVDEIRRLAESAEVAHRSRFLFGDALLTRVPHEVGQLAFARHEIPVVQMDGKMRAGDPGPRLVERRRRWTLVLGSFGAGKSTLARRVARESSKRLLYVPAAALTHGESGTQGENALARGIVAYMGLFDNDSECTDDEKQLLYWLAGPLLAARLRDPKTDLVLLIDAIDENRFYSSLRGFQVLLNELSSASCNIVLTTRYEHFIDHYQTYAGKLGESGAKAPKEVQLLRLHDWTEAQATQYIITAGSIAQAEQQEALLQLLILLESGELPEVCVQHPILLAMTTDIFVSHGFSLFENQADLYRRWTRFKLARDYEVSRDFPPSMSNVDLLIAQVLELMVDVAVAMTSQDGELLDSISEHEIRQLTQARFDLQVPSDLYTTASLLEPIQSRSAGGMRLRFFHRSFHEYFLAVAIHSRGLSANAFPASVREFLVQLEKK